MVEGQIRRLEVAWESSDEGIQSKEVRIEIRFKTQGFKIQFKYENPQKLLTHFS